MYSDILKSIENLQIDQIRKKDLFENCFEYIFSWNPCKIKRTEWYKRFDDWKKLKKYKNELDNTSAKPKKIECSSDFYSSQLNTEKEHTKEEISVMIQKYTRDDIMILLAMKTLNSQIWHNRISAFWTTLISLLSLIVAISAIIIKTGAGN